MKLRIAITGALAALCLPLISEAALAEGPVARINGVEISEAQLALAENEIASKIAGLAPAMRKRALVEYLVEAHLFAEEAKKAGLDKGKEFEDRLAYYNLRALRDVYYEKKLRAGISDEETKKSYDELVAKLPPEPEVHARHILVKTEEEAKDIVNKLKGGAKFEELAAKSIDPVSAKNGGDLGFVSKDQTVKPFEDAMFKLEVGQISEPVQTDFGWHVIKVEEKRNRPVPPFEAVKDRLSMALLQNQMRTNFFTLREAAKVEMLDPDLKKMVEEEQKEIDNAKAAAEKNKPGADQKK